MLRELRLAVRGLARTPGFTAVAILTLAMGLGATTAVYSVVNGVLLNPLPVHDPDRLVTLRESRLPQFPSFSVAPAHFLAWQRESQTLESVAAVATSFLILTGSGDPDRLRADRATSGLFPLLGVPPVLGRYFGAGEDRPGADPVVVISERLWRSRFGGSACVLGQPVTLSGKPHTVIGIAPAALAVVLGDAQAWVPMAMDTQEAELHGSHYLRALARLQPGVGAVQARADLDRVALQLEAAFPDANRGWRVLVDQTHTLMVRNVRTALWTLSAAVGLVLVVVCANVASLMLARGLSRQRELAVRAALGAERSRLAGALLVESLSLSIVAAGLGLGIAYGILRALTWLGPATLPRLSEVGLDLAALAFAAVVALVAPLLFGLLPALQVARTDLRESLAAGGRSVATALRARTRAALVVSQIALALVLLIGCTLLIRSFVRLVQVDPGFDAENTIVAGLQVPSQKYPEPAARLAFQMRLLERVSALPGVEAAGLTQSLPLANDFVASLDFEGRPAVDATERPSTNFYSVSPGYFAAMGIAVTRGRAIDPGDRDGAARVLVVNETFARRFYPGEDPIGRRVMVSQGPSGWREIVGVVADTKQYGLASETSAQVYESFQQQAFSSVEIVVRTAIDPLSLGNSLRAATRAIDPDQPIGRVTTLRRLVDTSLGSQRFSLALFTAFAGVALVLAAIGLYGLVSYGVSQRSLEIGVRLALGARPGDVSWLVLRQALALAAAGIGIGTAGAFGVTGLMKSLLFETSPNDAATFLLVPLLLLAVVVVASLIPARRAARLDPLVTLRGE